MAAMERSIPARPVSLMVQRHSQKRRLVNTQASADNLVNLLVYETDRNFAGSNNLINSDIPGLVAQTVGLGESFNGFGSKYTAMLPVLQRLDPSALTVISDGRDVLLNHKANGSSDAESPSAVLEAFVESFHSLVGQREGAIVVSAEAQCCVSALTFAAPGDYFAPDGSRSKRACFSGKSDCMWNGDENALPWENFMKGLAKQNAAEKRDDIYLNAGLMVGRAADLINVITKADIGSEEDDQAVLTGYMFLHPDEIVLDYNQALFGNNRDTCMFELHNDQLVHKQTQTTPLLIHSPGARATCHIDLMAELGQTAMSKTVRRRLSEYTSTVKNYKECPDDHKMVSGYCVRSWCFADFQCPKNSVRLPNRLCYSDVDDCQCKAGYYMHAKGYCARNTSW
jgi:hypothetical protein